MKLWDNIGLTNYLKLLPREIYEELGRYFLTALIQFAKPNWKTLQELDLLMKNRKNLEDITFFLDKKIANADFLSKLIEVGRKQKDMGQIELAFAINKKIIYEWLKEKIKVDKDSYYNAKGCLIACWTRITKHNDSKAELSESEKQAHTVDKKYVEILQQMGVTCTSNDIDLHSY